PSTPVTDRRPGPREDRRSLGVPPATEGLVGHRRDAHTHLVNMMEPYGQLPLYPGETVLWTGAPAKHRPPIDTRLLAPSGMALVGLALMVPGLLASFSPSLLVFLLVWEGIAFTSGPLRWLREWRTNRTVRYAATDRRILVTSHNRGPQSE